MVARSRKKEQATGAKRRAKSVPKEDKELIQVAEALPAARPLTEKQALEIRERHPKVTDQQATLVAQLLQTGTSIAQAARELNVNADWAYQALRKPHVMAYSGELAKATLHVAALQALGTQASLLNAKSEWLRSEVARDILDRAGFTVDRASSAPAVNVNIKLD